MQKFYLSDADATIQKLQNQLKEAQITIEELDKTVNSQLDIISSQRSDIESLLSLISQPPAITYVDYPLCMNYSSIELVTQVNWLVLSLFYKYDSGSHFWWLSCGTSQITYQYDKMWHINEHSTPYFALANFTDVKVSHAGTEASDTHLMLFKPSDHIYTECYTDTPYLLIPISIDHGRISTLKVEAEGAAHFYSATMSELSASTFPIFLPKS